MADPKRGCAVPSQTAGADEKNDECLEWRIRVGLSGHAERDEGPERGNSEPKKRSSAATELLGAGKSGPHCCGA